MRTVTITFELLSWWHAGSGMGRGGDADALVIRATDDGLPYLPGKTVKGLLRDAVQLADEFKRFNATGQTDILFGRKDPSTPVSADTKSAEPYADHESPGRAPGQLCFNNAELSQEIADWLRAGGEERKNALFNSLACTALDDHGVAKEKSLRTIEVCPPLTLTAEVTGPDDDDWIKILSDCARLIRCLGSHRHRGLGRCRVSVAFQGGICANQPKSPDPESKTTLSKAVRAAGVVWLEIHLLSDVIVSAKAATVGGHDSLNYLPGSVMLGAAAERLFKKNGFGSELFLTGQVRFGDGLPAENGDAIDWPVPLNCHYIKKDGPKGNPVNGLTDTFDAAKKRVQNKEQSQQARDRHLVLHRDNTAILSRLQGDYVIKTAIDREKFGRAQDRQLFEYDTLPAGSRFLAPIRWSANDESLADKVAEIVEVLTSPATRLGRSRNAQFGRVEISLAKSKPAEPQSLTDGVAAQEPFAPPHPLHFYLVSDLALSGQGGALLIPNPEELGLSSEWKLVPERTFLRTRRYSPWNAFHHTRLTERQVLVRGSVLTFAKVDEKQATPEEMSNILSFLANGVGDYRQEGLGWMVLNPKFALDLPKLLDSPKNACDARPAGEQLVRPADSLVTYVVRVEQDHAVQTDALKLGRHWAERWFQYHQQAAQAARLGRSGKSQWSQVRQLALSAHHDVDELKKSLTGFCDNGVRKKYWQLELNLNKVKSSLSDHLKKAIDPQTKLPDNICLSDNISDNTLRGRLLCAAVAFAAETMVQRLQGTEQSREVSR